MRLINWRYILIFAGIVILLLMLGFYLRSEFPGIRLWAEKPAKEMQIQDIILLIMIAGFFLRSSTKD